MFPPDKLGGKKIMLEFQRNGCIKNGEMVFDVPAEYRHKIMHSEFRADDFVFGASDNLPGNETLASKNFAMLVSFSETREQEETFSKLLEGGRELMPLAETPTGSRFGMLVDRYGVQWMLAGK